MRGKVLISLFMALGLAAAIAPSASPSSRENAATQASGKRVAVEDNFFDPRSLTIRRGTPVTWNWKGDNPHNLTFLKTPVGASKRGADTRRHGRFRRYFWKRGVYRYECTLFDGMVGTVYVR